MFSFSAWLQNFWYNVKQYKKMHPLRLLAYPLHIIFRTLVSCRRNFYQYDIFKSTKVDAAVIIVGNISVGGTGKSPLVLHLAKEMPQLGYKVGILSRGYGAQTKTFPTLVETSSLASDVGDEPLMLRLRTDCPVVIDPNRVRGAKFLINACQCDLILCDDGIQHYPLSRDIELLLIDSRRRFGNEMMMPVGPLREPVSRLNTVDAVIVNQSSAERDDFENLHINQFKMELKSTLFCRVNAPKISLSIDDFLSVIKNTNVYAVAAIGNPQRFFDQISALGILSQNTNFSDHYPFKPNDFKTMTGIVIMTEKDATKCKEFASDEHWFLKVDAIIQPSLSTFCHQRLLEQNYS